MSVALTTSCNTDEDCQFWAEFIQLYKEYPCLWKIKSKEYSDKAKKNAEYDLLVEKLKEKDSNEGRMRDGKRGEEGVYTCSQG